MAMPSMSNPIVIRPVDERPATADDVEELLDRIPWLRDVFPGASLHRRVEAARERTLGRN